MKIKGCVVSQILPYKIYISSELNLQQKNVVWGQEKYHGCLLDEYSVIMFAYLISTFS